MDFIKQSNEAGDNSGIKTTNGRDRDDSLAQRGPGGLNRGEE
jgi:hypothetical protein